MNKTIEQIDPNFQRREIGGRQLNFINALQPPFELSGFGWYRQEQQLCRLPKNVMARSSPALQYLAWNTSGGMIRFRTDSPQIAVRAELRDPADMNHMPRNGSAGFDLYLGAGPGKQYLKSVMPDSGALRVEALPADNLSPDAMREWTLYLPLYGGVKHLEIGLAPDARLEAPSPFALPLPLGFYGSSITQGGCASRTGNAYTNMLAREFDAPLYNWGFSGNGFGEPMVAEAIAELPMAAFVLDYDHNAPSADHLAATHEPFFRLIRARQPNLPVIMISKPDFAATPEGRNRQAIIRRTWQHAVDAGDRHVDFIDGETLFGNDHRDACTVDTSHPNDLGFFRMFQTIAPVLRRALEKAGVTAGGDAASSRR